MIIVIQCAAMKRSDAGHLLSASGKPVEFVANPETAPPDPARDYARPDDPSSTGVSWRKVLLNYNQEAGHNPLGLCPAYQLYVNETYTRLVNRLGFQRVYILSAGWGMIRADFLTPYYDITFSQSAKVKPYKRRRSSDRYEDFHMLPEIPEENIFFFGGRNYLPLFSELTNEVETRKTVFYNSSTAPVLRGCELVRFETTTRTNWHYQCANAFLDGKIRIL